jgi:hypothetical protein
MIRPTRPPISFTNNYKAKPRYVWGRENISKWVDVVDASTPTNLTSIPSHTATALCAKQINPI